MKNQETKIIKIEDYQSGNISKYRYSNSLTNPIMKKKFIINVKNNTDKFSVSDLFN